jgi:glucosamine-phosphate N-acetyltransferase
MIIREFVKEDINNGLISLLKEVWHITEITDETYEDFTQNNNHMFVVEYEGQIIGCATLHLQKKLIRDGGIAGFIEDVIIKEKFRGKEIGSLLIKKLIDKSKELGCYKVVLSCFPERENFYIKNGFYKESANMRYEYGKNS